MIDIENIFSLRTVEDLVVQRSGQGGRMEEEILGTKVGDRILSRDADTLFPLQGILGFNISQTLFVGPYVLVVEGPTERAVLSWFSRELIRRNRESLDIRWAVCPAEGASKISSFVTLFSGRGLSIAVLADYHEGQKGMIDRLEASDLLAPGHLLKTSDFCAESDSDIEDVIGRELYVDLVNRSMGLSGTYQIQVDALPTDEPRVVKAVEGHLAVLPPGFPEFNHYLPVGYLQSLAGEEVNELPGLAGALDRFEALFAAANSLMPAGHS
jgi:hypothetical protein